MKDVSVLKLATQMVGTARQASIANSLVTWGSTCLGLCTLLIIMHLGAWLFYLHVLCTHNTF